MDTSTNSFNPLLAEEAQGTNSNFSGPISAPDLTAGDLLFNDLLETSKGEQSDFELNLESLTAQKLYKSRKHPRVPLKGQCLFYTTEGKVAGKGVGFDLSEGGIGVHPLAGHFSKGQVLNFEYLGCNEHPAFSVRVEVTRSPLVKRGSASPTHMGLRILKIGKRLQNQIRKHTSTGG